MRRLVGISSKAKKSIMALMALAISLASIHMAAAARSATLKREQELAALSNQQSALSHGASTPMPNAPFEADPIAGEHRGSAPAKQAKRIEDKSPVPLDTPARQRQIIISIADRKL